MRFSRVLLTGAAGRIGSCLRPGLRDELDELRLTDSRPVADLSAGETYTHAELDDRAAVGRWRASRR